jgi:hypothetical protein
LQAEPPAAPLPLAPPAAQPQATPPPPPKPPEASRSNDVIGPVLVRAGAAISSGSGTSGKHSPGSSLPYRDGRGTRALNGVPQHRCACAPSASARQSAPGLEASSSCSRRHDGHPYLRDSHGRSPGVLSWRSHDCTCGRGTAEGEDEHTGSCLAGTEQTNLSSVALTGALTAHSSVAAGVGPAVRSRVGAPVGRASVRRASCVASAIGSGICCPTVEPRIHNAGIDRCVTGSDAGVSPAVGGASIPDESSIHSRIRATACVQGASAIEPVRALRGAAGEGERQTTQPQNDSALRLHAMDKRSRVPKGAGRCDMTTGDVAQRVVCCPRPQMGVHTTNADQAVRGHRRWARYPQGAV